MAEKINVEVIYALANQQDIARVSLPKGSTATQAIEASGLLVKHPEIDLKKNKIGVFAKLAKADTVLRDRDRIEIYRPLIADPKEVRKQRAAEGHEGQDDEDHGQQEDHDLSLFYYGLLDNRFHNLQMMKSGSRMPTMNSSMVVPRGWGQCPHPLSVSVRGRGCSRGRSS